MHRFMRFANGPARKGFFAMLLVAPLLLGIWLGELDGSWRGRQQPCLQVPAGNSNPETAASLDQFLRK